MLPTAVSSAQPSCDAVATAGIGETVHKLRLGMLACIDRLAEVQRLEVDNLRTKVEQLFEECAHSTHRANSMGNDFGQQPENSEVLPPIVKSGSPEARSISVTRLSKHTEGLYMTGKDIDDLVSVLGWKKHGHGKLISSSNVSPSRCSRACGGWMPCHVPVCGLSRCVRNVVGRQFFKTFVTFLILLNTFFIGIVSQDLAKTAFRNYDARARGELASFASPSWFDTCDVFFCIAFSIELLLRIVGEQGAFFEGADCRWNMFDMFLVLTSIVEEVVSSIDLSFFRILRVFRAVRVMRVVRVVYAFYALRLLLVAIMAAVMPLLWAFIFLLVVLFLFGALIQDQVTNYIESLDGVSAVDEATVLTLRRLCPCLSMTLQTLFMSITGGINWVELWEPLDQISFLASSLYTGYIAFMVLGVLNIVTGIFVEGSMKAAQNDTDLVIRAELEYKESCFNSLRELFIACDTDGSGQISWDEFRTQTQRQDVRSMFMGLDLDVLEAEGLFKLLDLRGTREVSIEEFVVGCMRLKGNNMNVNFASLLYENKQCTSVLLDKLAEILQKMNLLEERTGCAKSA